MCRRNDVTCGLDGQDVGKTSAQGVLVAEVHPPSRQHAGKVCSDRPRVEARTRDECPCPRTGGSQYGCGLNWWLSAGPADKGRVSPHQLAESSLVPRYPETSLVEG